MSTLSRIISGSIASWITILLGIVIQIIVVPIYLSYWDIKTYSIWISVQALIGIVSIIEKSHQTFLGYEFLMVKNKAPNKLGLYILSGIWVGVTLGLLQCILAILFISTPLFELFLGKNELLSPHIINEAGKVLLVQIIAGFISGSVGGILVRAVAPFGYYPRMAWWGILATFNSAIFPALVVTQGGGLFATGLALASASIVSSILVYFDLFRLLRKENISLKEFSFKLGWINFRNSLALTFKDLFDNLRQQGVRVVLSPLCTPKELVTFSTLRTGANVALQGLNTITNPLMPELMRFLHQKEQAHSEAAFGTVWIIVVAIMAPGIVILQAFIEPLFLLWTRGKTPFDPLLFAILSLCVLVYAVAQPAISVTTGNNLVKPQLFLSALSATIVVVLMFTLVPSMGLQGAGLSLLIAELSSAIGYQIIAMQWLKENQLIWPKQLFSIAAMAVISSAITLLFLIEYPASKWIILTFSLVIFSLIFRKYWKTLPATATDRALKFFANVPGLNLFSL